MACSEVMIGISGLWLIASAGHDDGAIDGGALLTVDMLRIGQPQRVQILADELDFAL
jgi:hypothetical protein